MDNQRNQQGTAKCHHDCLGRILRIFWPNTINNIDLWDPTNPEAVKEPADEEKRQLDWFHTQQSVCNQKQSNNHQTGLDMVPTGNAEEETDKNPAGEGGPRQTEVVVFHQWPMFLQEYKGLK